MYVKGLNEGLRDFGEWVGRNAKDQNAVARYSVPHHFREFIALIDSADEAGSLRVRADHRVMNEVSMAHMAYRLTGIIAPRVLVIDPAKPFERPEWMSPGMFDSYRNFRFLPDVARMVGDRHPNGSGDALPIFAGQMSGSPSGTTAQKHLGRGMYKEVDERLKPLRKPLLETLPKLLNVVFARGTSLESESIFDSMVVDSFLCTLKYLAAGFIVGDQDLTGLYGEALQDYLLTGVPIYADNDTSIFLKARAR